MIKFIGIGITSVKLTMSERFAISRYAKESGVSVSSYMVMKAMQKDGLTPALLVKIQNLLNVAIKVIDQSDPYMVDYLKKEMHELWEFLS